MSSGRSHPSRETGKELGMMQAKNGHDDYPKPGAANGQQGRYETIENAVRVEETFKLNSKGV